MKKTFVHSISNIITSQSFLFYFCRLFSAFLLVLLTILPIGMESLVLGNFSFEAAVLYPVKLPFYESLNLPLRYFSFLLNIMPVTAFMLIVSCIIKIFQNSLEKKEHPAKNLPLALINPKNNYSYFIAIYIGLSIYLLISTFCLMIFSNTPRWFASLPKSCYISFSLVFISHFLMTLRGLHQLKKLNPNYTEYIRLKKTEPTEEGKKGRLYISVKTKFTATMISTITSILIIFLLIIFNIYHKSYTTAVSSMGRAQAERAANLWVTAGGRYAKISPFLHEQSALNAYADTPFVRIDMLVPSPRIKTSDRLYLEKIYDYLQNGSIVEVENIENKDLPETEETPSDSETPFVAETSSKAQTTVTLQKQLVDSEGQSYTDILTIPDLNEFSYTTAEGSVANIDPEEKIITAKDALKYIKLFMDGSYSKAPVLDKKKHIYKYIYPIYRIESDGTELSGRLFQGFSIVSYYQELLMRSYFHAKVLVITWSVIFLYVSIIIALLLADLIVNPLLFLRANVHKTSQTLARIKDGDSSITAKDLVYQDAIKTEDEIKDLSKEISTMTGTIRGILPYISTSTLQATEKSNKKPTTSRELCFLFTDIRGFTTLCEHKTPKEVVEILNHYLEIETEIILRNDGDIDKFVGDEMMAFFSGPKKEINACKAAMEIRTAMRAQQEQALLQGGDFISMGIGINSGKVIFGSVGARSRMDFTSIGDTVNLAARLESANKAYGSKAIITEAVYKKLKDTFVCRELDFLTVKGKSEPVRIYEILQTKSAATPKLYEIKELFEQGLEEYRKKHWDKAEENFRLCNEKYTDMPSIVFIDRIAHFRVTPPPRKWDGVFELKVK